MPSGASQKLSAPLPLGPLGLHPARSASGDPFPELNPSGYASGVA